MDRDYLENLTADEIGMFLSKLRRIDHIKVILNNYLISTTFPNGIGYTGKDCKFIMNQKTFNNLQEQLKQHNFDQTVIEILEKE